MTADVPETYAKKLQSIEARQAPDRDPEALAAALASGDEKWSNLSLDGIRTGYRRVIEPQLEAAGHDPTTTVPNRAWLAEIGHRNLEYALREYHDLTLTRFCVEHVGVEPSEESWTWPVEDPDTRAELADWERTQRERLADVSAASTVRTRRSRLATYCRLYRDEHGTDDLLAPLGDAAAQREATTNVVTVYDRLNDRLSTTASKQKYHRTVAGFYDFLVTGGRAAFNPTDGLMETRFGWTTAADDGDGVQALAAEQIQQLYRAATSTTDRLLVVALGAWGLRRGEVAALHRRQLVLDPPETDVPGPYIEFDARKNAAGTVALLYGSEAVRDRLTALTDVWTDHSAGYLFPSEAAESGHIDGSTVYRRFRTLAERADVQLADGSQPTPHNCRKFWYDAYSSVMADLDELLAEVAADQGSVDVKTVKGHYVEASTLRELRRDRMRARLETAFAPLD